jgi:uncharacterized protein YdeI (YjbR/CyaY-like superfamily)
MVIFPNSEKDTDIRRYLEPQTDQKRSSLHHIIARIQRIQNNERIFRVAEGICQIICKEKIASITADFF